MAEQRRYKRYTVKEAAEILDVSTHTVSKWCKNGTIRSIKEPCPSSKHDFRYLITKTVITRKLRELREARGVYEGEVWKTVDEFPMYEVSSFGRIRRKPGTYVNSSREGTKPRALKPAVISSRSHGSKDHNIVVFRHDGQQTCRGVAGVVARAFIGPPPPRSTVRHKNGDVLDDRAEHRSTDLQDAGRYVRCIFLYQRRRRTGACRSEGS